MLRHALLIAFAGLALAACDDDDDATLMDAAPSDASVDAEADAGDGSVDAEADAGDADDAGPELPPVTPPSLVGTYTDEFGSVHLIGETDWTMSMAGEASVFHYIAVDNAAAYLVAQGDAENAYNPSLFSRFDWTTADSALWFCQAVYDAPTAEAAAAVTSADRTALETTGCGGFPWTKLTALPAPEIIGDFTDDFGGAHHLDATTWTMGVGEEASRFHYYAVDNDADFLVAQADAQNAYNPNLFSRFDWANTESGLWFCQITYDAPSAEAAAAVTTADRAALETTGCGGFPWSRLSIDP